MTLLIFAHFASFSAFPDGICHVYSQISTKPGVIVDIPLRKCPIEFEVERSKVKVTEVRTLLVLRLISVNNLVSGRYLP